MKTLSASEARANLYRLMDQIAENHEPVVISGERVKAVLIAEEDWHSINETLYLLAIPGVRESVKNAMSESMECTSNELDW